jgi:hypothetical protein
MLLSAFKVLGENKKVLANVLCVSPSFQKYRHTLFFKELFLSPTEELDRLLYFQLLLNWKLYTDMVEIFDTFPWQTPGKVSPIVLTTLVMSMRNIEDNQIIEKMLNTLIPYSYQSGNQDYSNPVFGLHQFLFVETKKNESRRKSEGYNSVLAKYCVQ